jgi:zinc protease
LTDPADPVVRSRLGDIPFYAVEAPGPFWAGLVFRVGRCDEVAATTGITHLVEHLLMPARVYTDADCNATVDTMYASIWAFGEQSEVRRFLEDVVARIHALPVDRLELERGILEAEEGATGWSGVRQALALRFGPVGPGLAGYGDLGLPRITADEARRWTTERFTSGNVVLAATDSTFEIDLDLPPGPARPLPELRPIPYVEYPSFYASGAPGSLVVSLVAERSTAFTNGLWILERRLRDRLRFELGIAYDLDVDFQPLTARASHAWVAADAGQANGEQWLSEALATLDTLVEDGPTEEEIQLEGRNRRRQLADPGGWVPWLSWAAGRHLLGEPYESREDLVRQTEALQPAEVAEALGRAHASLLVLTSDEVSSPPGFAEYPLTSPHSIEGGRVHRLAGLRARLGRSGSKDRLTASPEGVMIEYAEASPPFTLTARYDATVLCLRMGEMRTLLADDGFYVTIVPDAWADGKKVVADIDAAIPHELVVTPDPLLDTRLDQVRAVAGRTFKRTFLVSDELAALPGLLEDDEELLALASGSRGWRLGLLAVTDRRIRFVYGDGTEHSFTLGRDEGVVKRMGKSDFALLLDGEWVKLTDVGPRRLNDELARVLDV